MIHCACGCGQLVKTTFVHGHNRRGITHRNYRPLPPRNCYCCGRTESETNKWTLNHDAENNVLCARCFAGLYWKVRIDHDKKLKWEREHSPMRIQFKDKRLRLSEAPRTGVCSWCKRSVHRGEIKRTQMHHFAEYNEADPLKDTIEICVACHNLAHYDKYSRQVMSV